MKTKILCVMTFMVLCVFFLSGCVKLALRLSPSLFPAVASSFFSECDPEFAKSSIPANLKLLEGILKNDPENSRILTALSMGFYGYSMLFVEAEDPERASDLHLRAGNYGMKALGDKGMGLMDLNSREVHSVLAAIGGDDLEALFWITVSWYRWIQLNLDKPAALAQLPKAQACLERVIEIDADYLHGLPYIVMGVSLSAKSQLFGGDIAEAKNYFEKALKLTNRKFFLAQYYFARYYAVRVQDRALFSKLLKEIIRGDPTGLNDVCLINSVIYGKARHLMDKADDLFF